jgi:HD-GYP domain-containing protein (c-di-GMP phosphodiesterase class II)
VPFLFALSRAIEARDRSSGHAARVTALAEVIAARLGWDEERLAQLRVGGAVHDVGKLAVPAGVLRKAEPLTDDDVAKIRKHPAAGARMVRRIRPLRRALGGVLYHHERWDGRGYPTGRARHAIPEEARVLAVADSFDAMTSDRPYRPALPVERAVEEVERCAGTQFDPEVVRAFVEAWEAGETPVADPSRMTLRRRGAMGECEARTQGALVAGGYGRD